MSIKERIMTVGLIMTVVLIGAALVTSYGVS